jgi:hypothetical protein
MNVFKDKAGPPTNEVKDKTGPPANEVRAPTPSHKVSNVVPIETSDAELLEALKKLGEDILNEPTPQQLIEILRPKKR